MSRTTFSKGSTPDSVCCIVYFWASLVSLCCLVWNVLCMYAAQHVFIRVLQGFGIPGLKINNKYVVTSRHHCYTIMLRWIDWHIPPDGMIVICICFLRLVHGLYTGLWMAIGTSKGELALWQESSQQMDTQQVSWLLMHSVVLQEGAVTNIITGHQGKGSDSTPHSTSTHLLLALSPHTYWVCKFRYSPRNLDKKTMECRHQVYVLVKPCLLFAPVTYVLSRACWTDAACDGMCNEENKPHKIQYVDSMKSLLTLALRDHTRE